MTASRHPRRSYLSKLSRPKLRTSQCRLHLQINSIAYNGNPTKNHALTSRTIYNARSDYYDDSYHPHHVLNTYNGPNIQWAYPQPGQHILDLACGKGLVALAANPAVGLAGTVIAIAISDGIIELDKQKARKQMLEVL